MTTATKAKAATKARKKAPKPKVKNTLLSVLLDRSGSMSSFTHATIEGFNKFINEQRDQEGIGLLRLTLVQFDDRYEVNFTAEDVEDVPALDTLSYQPRGMTALNDALFRSITDTERWVTETNYTDDVIFLIITDGQENASKEASLQQVAELIRRKEDEGWSFVFMGANIDSFATGQSYNIPAGNVANFATNDMDGSFKSASVGMTAHRSSGGMTGQSATYMAAAAGVSDSVKTIYDNTTDNVTLKKDTGTGKVEVKKKK